MSGPAVPPDGEELREALEEVVRRWWGPGAADPRIVRDLADAVLALPAVRDALAAQEKLRRVEELAEEYERHAGLMQAGIDSGIRPDMVTRLQSFEDAAASLRRTLDGDS